MTDQPTDPQPHWTIEITLDSEDEYTRVMDAVIEILHDMGEIGYIFGQKWNPVP